MGRLYAFSFIVVSVFFGLLTVFPARTDAQIVDDVIDVVETIVPTIPITILPTEIPATPTIVPTATIIPTVLPTATLVPTATPEPTQTPTPTTKLSAIGGTSNNQSPPEPTSIIEEPSFTIVEEETQAVFEDDSISYITPSTRLSESISYVINDRQSLANALLKLGIGLLLTGTILIIFTHERIKNIKQNIGRPITSRLREIPFTSIN